jgi:thiol-disulfide isomerase/thioredoxin
MDARLTEASRRRWSRLIALVLILAPVGCDGRAGEVAGVPDAADSRRAPVFAFEDINPRSDSHGKTLALADLYADQGVILNFVASWCAPCWEEIPALQKLHDDDRLPIVCVAADEYGDTGDLLRKAEQAKLSLPILHVPKDQIKNMERLYDHALLPATYVIDPRGVIREVFQGKISDRTLLERAGASLR